MFQICFISILVQNILGLVVSTSINPPDTTFIFFFNFVQLQAELGSGLLVHRAVWRCVAGANMDAVARSMYRFRVRG